MSYSHWVWLTVALPLGGFLVNGAVALRRPGAKALVSVVGPGVLLGAFGVSLGVFRELLGQPTHEPLIVKLWPWLQVGQLRADILNGQLLVLLASHSHALPGPVLDELIKLVAAYRGPSPLTGNEFMTLRYGRRAQ